MAEELTPAAHCLGVKVPPSPFLNEMRIKRINAARYEGDEIAGALSIVTPEDRVIEMGAGLGIVGAVVARNARPERILSFEANSSLLEYTRKLYEINGLNDVIELRNQIVVSDPEAPDSIPFHIANSFLGSSLLENRRRTSETVDLPTQSFEYLRAEFAPTILVMDIEGGELDFLRHADLTGIRGIVIEFHPGVYDREGMRECKRLLTSQGFKRHAEVSTRTVWTATRPLGPDGRPLMDTPSALPGTMPPDPTGGWSTTLEEVPNALVVPPAGNGLVEPSGVFTADGVYLPQGALWRNARALMTEPDRPAAPAKRLGGTWIWGSALWLNFAHFVVEGTARLWALNEVDPAEISGVLYVPKRQRNGATVHAYQREFLSLMGFDGEMRSTAEPVEVERLILPGQGFGLGRIVTGTEAFRAAFAARFGRNVRPEGPEKLYISRSLLGTNRGGLLGETMLEAHLEAQGYEIFHPQQHDLTTQVARYKAARQIIAADGSALHVTAFCAGPQTAVAMLLRRRSGASGQIAQHLEAFTGRTPHVIDALSTTWQPAGSTRKRLTLGQLNMATLQDALQHARFIDPGPRWEEMPASEIRALLGDRYIAQ
ncbi:FkbM family methyltransferase [Poseidonocella sedimentorum]|uniref:Methyltransferase, FkbM family n=1 Tax=Poseidonocella sedimentorum TaxID=871652 RepID=A0A1I6EI94_9RHOB|nr:FkbM family methyltransferase [Poseidonocella sedimentorum]SFR17238.1 methyltransferase, FkbM family [Poseidonocella sedimentorum]